LAVVAVSYGFLLMLASAAAGFMGLPLAIAVLLSLFRYCYELLRNAARGRQHMSAPDLDSMNPVGDFRVVLHAALFVSLAVLATRLPLFGLGPVFDVTGFAAALAAAAVFPASAAWLALTGDLAGALNPRNLLELIGILGRRYGLLLLAWSALGLVLWLAAVLPLPHFLDVLLVRVLGVWALLGFFVITGAELRGHRHRFAIPGEIEPPAERRERERRLAWQNTLDRAYASLRSGLRTQGYETIRELVESEHGSLEIQQWTFDRMLTWEDKRDAFAFASRLVESLLSKGEQYEALELVTRCRRLSGRLDLRPESSAAMAEFARSIGRQGIADELLESVR
ncbi:MAG TPA: hypothetical protein VFY39_11540, partial [Gammaproteobacteria bacterium]|nr:hypothetical protein [Gammaproteobacteria bacterium]